MATEQAEKPDCGLWQVDNATYHADIASQSHSMLEKFRKSPLKYESYYITKTLVDEPTESLRLGTALHAFLLEHDRFDDLIAVEPEVNRRTNEGKRIVREFAANRNGRTIITEEQMAMVPRMAKAILAHDEVLKLFRLPHKREQAVRWIDAETGLRCRLKTDILLDSFVLIADIKTSKDPTPGSWLRDAVKYGYHRQDAFYGDGIRAAFDVGPRFMHIVVQNQSDSPSERLECACYYLDDDAVQLGRAQNRKDLDDLARCLETGDFTQPRHKQIEILSYPRYAFFE